MAKSRRKAGGATSGRYKPKRMGKGWSAYRSKLGFRPPMVGKDTVGKGTVGNETAVNETAAKMTVAEDPATATKEAGAAAETPKTAPKPAAKKTAKKAAKKVAAKSKKLDGDAE